MVKTQSPGESQANVIDWTEITHAVFRLAVTIDVPSTKVIECERARWIFYDCHGVSFLHLQNYTSGVSQYYLRDINL
jgi:hypothetical protein